MALSAHSFFRSLEKTLKIFHGLWHLATQPDLIIVISVCFLNWKAQGESFKLVGFDLLCSELRSVPALRQSISAASTWICGHVGEEPVCGDRSRPAFFWGGFLLWPSTCCCEAVSFRTGWYGVYVQASWVTTIYTDRGEWSDGASTHGQHPWQISCQTDSFHWLNTG